MRGCYCFDEDLGPWRGVESSCADVGGELEEERGDDGYCHSRSEGGELRGAAEEGRHAAVELN